MLWLANMNTAGSEVGAGPVGPPSGKSLMLVYVGRAIALWLGVAELVKELARRL